METPTSGVAIVKLDGSAFGPLGREGPGETPMGFAFRAVSHRIVF